MIKNLEKHETLKAYIAGFIDGDGSIYGQIVKDKTSKWDWKITIKIGFYQKKSRNWYLQWLKKSFGNIGYYRERGDMADYTIAGKKDVLFLLKAIKPYLKIKKATCKLAIEVLEGLESINNRSDFIRVCEKVDKMAEFNDSKNRKITKDYIISYYSNN